MQYLPWIVTGVCLVLSYPISRLLKIKFWICLAALAVAAAAVALLPFIFENSTTFAEAMTVTAIVVIGIAVLILLVSLLVSLIWPTVASAPDDESADVRRSRAKALQISRQEIDETYGAKRRGIAPDAPSWSRGVTPPPAVSAIPERLNTTSTFEASKSIQPSRSRRQREALLDIALVHASHTQSESSARHSRYEFDPDRIRSDSLFDIPADELNDIPEMPDDIKFSDPPIPIECFEPLELEHVYDTSQTQPVEAEFAALQTRQSSEPEPEPTPDPAEPDPEPEQAPAPSNPQPQMSVPFMNSLEKAYSFMRQNRWNEAAEVFEFTRLLQGTDEQKKKIELELINVLIRAGRPTEAVDAVFALLTCGLALGDSETELLRSLLENLHH